MYIYVGGPTRTRNHINTKSSQRHDLSLQDWGPNELKWWILKAHTSKDVPLGYGNKSYTKHTQSILSHFSSPFHDSTHHIIFCAFLFIHKRGEWKTKNLKEIYYTNQKNKRQTFSVLNEEPKKYTTLVFSFPPVHIYKRNFILHRWNDIYACADGAILMRIGLLGEDVVEVNFYGFIEYRECLPHRISNW